MSILYPRSIGGSLIFRNTSEGGGTGGGGTPQPVVPTAPIKRDYSGFVPGDLSNALHHWSADRYGDNSTNINLSSDNAVTDWIDKIGGAILTEATDSPVLVRGGMNPLFASNPAGNIEFGDRTAKDVVSDIDVTFDTNAEAIAGYTGFGMRSVSGDLCRRAFADAYKIQSHTDWSLFCRFRFASTGTSTKFLSLENQWELHVNASGNLFFEHHLNDIGGTETLTDTNAITVDTWHNAFIWKTGGSLFIQLDSNSSNTIVLSASTAGLNGELRLGGVAVDADMDSMAVWTRVISATERTALQNFYSRDAVSFSRASSQKISVPITTSNQTITIAALFYTNDTSASPIWTWSGGTKTASLQTTTTYTLTDATNSKVWGTHAAGVYKFIIIEINDTTQSQWVNGRMYYEDSNSYTGLINASSFTIGNTSTTFFDGSLLDLQIYSGSVSEENLRKLEGYCENFYELVDTQQTLLYSGHLFDTSIPQAYSLKDRINNTACGSDDLANVQMILSDGRYVLNRTGTNPYLTLPNASVYTPQSYPNGWTAAVRFKPISVDDTWKSVLVKGTYNVDDEKSFKFLIAPGSWGLAFKVRFTYYHDASGSTSIDSDTSVNVGSWNTAIFGVFDDAGQKKLFLRFNNDAEKTSDISYTTLPTGDGEVTIGADFDHATPVDRKEVDVHVAFSAFWNEKISSTEQDEVLIDLPADWTNTPEGLVDYAASGANERIFTPLELTTTLEALLEAGSGIALDGSSKVETWTDRSSNNRDATQTTVDRRPTYESSPVPRVRVIFISSPLAIEWMNWATDWTHTNQDHAAFVVWEPLVNVNGTIMNITDSGNGYASAFYQSSSSGQNVGYGNYTAEITTRNHVSTPIGDKYLITGIYDSSDTESKTRVDGDSGGQYTESTEAADISTITQSTIGAKIPNSDTGRGWVYAICIISQNDEATVQKVEAYLANLCSITLHSSHPYLNYAPTFIESLGTTAGGGAGSGTGGGGGQVEQGGVAYSQIQTIPAPYQTVTRTVDGVPVETVDPSVIDNVPARPRICTDQATITALNGITGDSLWTSMRNGLLTYVNNNRNSWRQYTSQSLYKQYKLQIEAIPSAVAYLLDNSRTDDRNYAIDELYNFAKVTVDGAPGRADSNLDDAVVLIAAAQLYDWFRDDLSTRLTYAQRQEIVDQYLKVYVGKSIYALRQKQYWVSSDGPWPHNIGFFNLAASVMIAFSFANDEEFQNHFVSIDHNGPSGYRSYGSRTVQVWCKYIIELFMSELLSDRNGIELPQTWPTLKNIYPGGYWMEGNTYTSFVYRIGLPHFLDTLARCAGTYYGIDNLEGVKKLGLGYIRAATRVDHPHAYTAGDKLCYGYGDVQYAYRQGIVRTPSIFFWSGKGGQQNNEEWKLTASHALWFARSEWTRIFNDGNASSRVSYDMIDYSHSLLWYATGGTEGTFTGPEVFRGPQVDQVFWNASDNPNDLTLHTAAGWGLLLRRPYATFAVGGQHGQMDAGAFQLGMGSDSNGPLMWITDSGIEFQWFNDLATNINSTIRFWHNINDYEQGKYDSRAHRYACQCISSFGHSVLIVDGKMQNPWGLVHLERVDFDKGFWVFNLSEAYSKKYGGSNDDHYPINGQVSYKRTFYVDMRAGKKNRVGIRDEYNSFGLAANKDIEVRFVFHPGISRGNLSKNTSTGSGWSKSTLTQGSPAVTLHMRGEVEVGSVITNFWDDPVAGRFRNQWWGGSYPSQRSSSGGGWEYWSASVKGTTDGSGRWTSQVEFSLTDADLGADFF